MIRTKSAGGVVVNNGLVLIVNQNGNSWSLPKGHIDEGEDALTAAKREIHEESGIKDLTFVADLGSYERYKIGLQGGDDESELKEIQMFLFTTKETDLSPIDPNNPEARFVDKNKVAELLTHEKDKAWFLKIRPRMG